MGNGPSALEVDSPVAKTAVSFELNGEAVVVKDASPLLSLNDWLRSQPGLAGTKRMCEEGGCGCCVVAVATGSSSPPLTSGGIDEDSWDCVLPEKAAPIAINSCLCPLYAVEGWSITTVEGLGSSSDGFHPIQLRLADFNGTQCGYCTPGFVMSMYSLLQKNPHPTKQQVEDTFDGNICRCTGYRSILDAMKSFAVDSNDKPCADIEDLTKGKKICTKTGKVCQGHLQCQMYRRLESDPDWYSPTSMAQVAALFAAHTDTTFRFVAGDTGKGVYKDLAKVEMLVDISHVAELQKIEVSETSLTVGAAVSIADLITALQTNASKSPSFMPLAGHLLKIANTPVRNRGTWAGNIMMAYYHDDFPSDVFLLLAASNVTLTTAHIRDLSTYSHTCWELLNLDLSASMIVSVELPFLASTVSFKSYKIMPRAENSVAYSSAAFAMTVDTADKCKVTDSPILVVGGGDTRPMLCPETSEFLKSKSLLDDSTLRGCMATLAKEMDASPSATDGYKKDVVLGLLYKFYISCVGSHCSPAVKSASSILLRPLSGGSQTFSPTPSEYPAGMPIDKLAAQIQASGEAEFTTDIPTAPNELAAAFVLTTKSNVVITKIDSSVAETLPGFVKILTAQDIPPGGVNNIAPTHFYFYNRLPEELFADYVSQYTGQAAALVLADTRQHAEKIAKAVTIEYGESQGPILVNTEDAMKANSFFEGIEKTVTCGDVKTAISKSDMTLRGQIECGSQYHFTMETQNSLVVPQEGETYAVYSSTQWTGYVQAGVANVLGIPTSSVDVSVKRVGGGFGVKATRANFMAAACALGAHKTRRPIRMHMDLETNMKMIGKRYSFIATYQIGFSKEGIVNGIVVNLFGNAGIAASFNPQVILFQNIDNAYHVPNWEINSKFCKTNIAARTACRSPGSLPAIFIMESMLDQVARTLKVDVDTIKKMNLYKDGQVTPTGITLKDCHLDTMWDDLDKSADVANRKAEISTFNKANRWMKRGMSVVPIKSFSPIGGLPFTVLVTIYAEDGTVAISHGGVEIGQGINTKVAQVAAMTLGIPMVKIKIKPCSTVTSPNSDSTGKSTTSELNCAGVMRACQTLKEKMQPVKDKNPDLGWSELVALCFTQNIDLSAKCLVTEGGSAPFYYTYGVAATEVELDVLTGQIQIPRVDILYDCGNSLNPKIDIGQVEGAFVMGLGYWLTEKIVHNKDSGGVTTFNTWTYKPPSSKDIPIDFRIRLLNNTPNPVGFLGSKAVGEPPCCMSCSALFAIKRAIEDARKDAGREDVFALSGPATIETIHSACLVDSQDFSL